MAEFKQPTSAMVPKVKWAMYAGAATTGLLAGLNVFAGELMGVVPITWHPLIVFAVMWATGYMKKDEA